MKTKIAQAAALATALVLVSFLSITNLLAADEAFKPFILAETSTDGLLAKADQVKSALETAGFTLAGEYSPLADTVILVVTNDELLEAAAGSGRGAYAAAQRISISEVESGTEVAFINPKYLRYAYQLDDSLDGVYAALTDSLGFEKACGGGNKKMTAKKLLKYNYMVGMQKFDDPSELGRFESHEAAVSAVESGLAKEDDGLGQVYRIDIPGTDQTLFGVSMKSGDPDLRIDESEQMAVVDFEGCRKRAYFPYEILVNGTEVEALHMRFRMAVHFPNLSMMGSHGFTKLMPYPGDIEEALESLVSGD